MRTFQASVWKEGEIFVAQCLDVDVVSQGHTAQEATANLREAVELFFETATAEEIRERVREGVRVSPFTAAVG